jgi:hypothetical protein
VLCAKGIKMRNDGSFCDHRCLQFAHVSSWSTYICSISECRICVNFARHPQSLNQKIELSIEPICSPGLWPRFFFSGPHVYTAVPVMKFSRHFWCDRIWRCKEMLCLQRLETLKDIQKPQSKIEICYILYFTVLYYTMFSATLSSWALSPMLKFKWLDWLGTTWYDGTTRTSWIVNFDHCNRLSNFRASQPSLASPRAYYYHRWWGVARHAASVPTAAGTLCKKPVSNMRVLHHEGDPMWP